MAVLPSNYATLVDIAKSLDPDGKTADIVELLKKETPMLEHMGFMAGNLETGHRTTIRSGYPSGTWRQLYQFVQPTKSTMVQVTDNCGNLEAYSVVDKTLIDLAGAAGVSFRAKEDASHVIGLGHQMAETAIYGNEGTVPGAFTGLSPRYNSLSAENADNIIDAGGTGSDNLSIWLIGWGDDKVTGIFPKNTRAGLDQRDLGEQTETDANGGKRQVMTTHFQWQAGLHVKDWRYACRICNVDVSNLTKDASGSSADLVDRMVDATERLPTLENAYFYAPRVARSFLRRQIINHKNVNLSFETVAGKRVMMLGEVPVYRHDSLVLTEARVV